MLAAVCSAGRDNFTVGLIDCSKSAYEGYTLLTPDRSNDAFLLDVHGREVHSWNNGPYPSRRGAYLGPDGSLYSSGGVNNPAQAGGGVTGALYIQDWDGNLTWQFEYATIDYTLHHDLEVMPNGNILAFAWVANSAADMVAVGRDPNNVPSGGLWGERIIELQPTGPTTADIVWQWNLTDHLVQDFDAAKPNFGVISDNPQRFDVNLGGSGNSSDWVHFNAIDYNVELDQIVVNSPFMSEFWVIDHSTTTAEAATSSGGNSGMGGDLLYRWGNPGNYDTPGDRMLFNQHDIQWIDPGNPALETSLSSTIRMYLHQPSSNSCRRTSMQMVTTCERQELPTNRLLPYGLDRRGYRRRSSVELIDYRTATRCLFTVRMESSVNLRRTTSRCGSISVRFRLPERAPRATHLF